MYLSPHTVVTCTYNLLVHIAGPRPIYNIYTRRAVCITSVMSLLTSIGKPTWYIHNLSRPLHSLTALKYIQRDLFPH